ncbi:MAG TPA: TRAP transporter large permease subunit [Gammaproteobacteria bacterium]|nr:TRAP transporter large permease subunit [Gammaproteobacteria bacterium]
MTDPQVALLMLGLLLLAIMLGFPICFTLIAMGVGFGFYAYYTPDISWFHNIIFDLLVNQTYSVMTSDVLVAVPLFLFMGYVVERANIVDRLFFSLNIAARAIPAPMAVAALATCALFATAVGIIGAVVTLMGLLAFPALLKAGYDTKFSAGVICAGGCLGILIPPSIMLIVYAATTAISVVQAYAAAIFPGLMLAGMYMVYVVIRAILNPRLAPKPPKEQTEMPMREVVWMMITSFVPLAVLIMAVLGAILFGWASPTEAAGVGAFGGLFLAACYRTLNWQMLRESVYLTVRTSAMVCWLFVGSWTFSSVFSYLGGEGLIEEFVLWLELSPLMFLIVAQIIIFLLGWPLEWSEIIIIFVPIFLPLLELFNIDPLFFGILVALNLQTSFMTPPMAMAAYYLKGVAPPHVQLMDIFRGCFPFLGIVILAMVILYNFPGIALWLPEQIYKVR